MYGDLATIYKREQAVYKDWYTYNTINVAIVGNHSMTARILKQAIEVQNTSIFTFEEVDNLLATFEQPMKTWASCPVKVRENHINRWKNVDIRKFDFYIVCDENEMISTRKLDEDEAPDGKTAKAYIHRLSVLFKFLDEIKDDLFDRKKATPKTWSQAKFLIFGNARWTTAGKVVTAALHYLSNDDLNIASIVSEPIYLKHVLRKLS